MASTHKPVEADRGPAPAVRDDGSSLVIRPGDLPFDGSDVAAPEPSLDGITVVIIPK